MIDKDWVQQRLDQGDKTVSLLVKFGAVFIVARWCATSTLWLVAGIIVFHFVAKWW